MAKVQRALISGSDKRGIVDFAKELVRLGIEILSTGGTAKTLKDADISVVDVSEYTQFPELLGGRLKTLHPKIHGGLLWRRDNEKDMEEVKSNDIKSIDLVVVNLYPFEDTVSRPDVVLEEAIENIDIGGPTMLRAAAKNFRDVAVVVDSSDYKKVLDDLGDGGAVRPATKFYLAQKVFLHTSRYDTLICNYLDSLGGRKDVFPDVLNMSVRKIDDLRYGENPHQKAALYRDTLSRGLSIVDAEILQGKAMSYNNYLDASAALDLVKEFEETTAVIVKHNNPCGVASADSPHSAFMKAFEVDPVSAFGGVIAMNRKVDVAMAQEILNLFVEIIIAPAFEPDVLKILSAKPNIRLLQLDFSRDVEGFTIRKIQGGMLVQDNDVGMIDDFKSLKVVTRRAPSNDEVAALKFGWKVCKHGKSNTIIYSMKDRAIGIGVGQTSRIDSAKLGAMKSLSSLKGSVVASDAFFPHRDGIDFIAKQGVTAVVQPGGSIKDGEVIEAADEYDMAMIFSGMRHFRH
jgi:phosphoribosylaminoimidazolecarboxamide formyltransferase/IMP cyclohydrolase